MIVDNSLVCYIKDYNTGVVVNFNVEKPAGYSDSYTANFQAQDVKGRSSPFQSFANSGPRSIDFSVLLSLDYRRKLDEQTKAVRNMFKPYNSKAGVLIKPPKVHVKIGKALEIDAVPQSFSAQWEGGYKEGVYRLCTWTFSFVEVEETGSYNEVSEAFGSEVPAGLLKETEQKISDNTGDDKRVGKQIMVTAPIKGYSTANEAINNNPINPTVMVDPGNYYIEKICDNAGLIMTTKGVRVWIIL